MKPPSTVWLLLLVFSTHYAYEFAPRKWAAFASGLGAMTAVLVWAQRGVRFKARWWLCLWAAIEGWEVFACQGAANWFTDVQAAPFGGMCDVLVGAPLYRWGLGAAALVCYLIAKEAPDG